MGVGESIDCELGAVGVPKPAVPAAECQLPASSEKASILIRSNETPSSLSSSGWCQSER